MEYICNDDGALYYKWVERYAHGGVCFRKPGGGRTCGARSKPYGGSIACCDRRIYSAGSCLYLSGCRGADLDCKALRQAAAFEMVFQMQKEEAGRAAYNVYTGVSCSVCDCVCIYDTGWMKGLGFRGCRAWANAGVMRISYEERGAE